MTILPPLDLLEVLTVFARGGLLLVFVAGVAVLSCYLHGEQD